MQIEAYEEHKNTATEFVQTDLPAAADHKKVIKKSKGKDSSSSSSSSSSNSDSSSSSIGSDKTEFVQTSPPGAPKPAAKGKNVAAIVAAAADGSFDKDPLTPEARKQL